MKKLTFIFFILVSITFSQSIERWIIFSDMKNVKGLTSSSDGIWAITNGGAFLYNSTSNTFITYSKADGFSSQFFTAIGKDKNNRIWLGANEGYINIFDKETGSVGKILDIFNTTKSKKQINNIFVKNDSVLVSTDFGLSIINANNLSFYDSFLKIGNFIAESPIVSAYKDNLIYVCTENGIAVQKSGSTNLSIPESWNTYQFNTQVPASNATKFVKYNNQILIGTNRGVLKFENNAWSQFILPETKIIDFEVVAGTLYLITTNKLYSYTNNQLTQLLENTTAIFQSLMVLSTQSIYISTTKGILEFKSGATKFLFPDGPAGNQFTNLTVDDSSNLWISTGRNNLGLGVMRYNGSSWRLFSKESNPELRSNDYYNVSNSGKKVFLSNWGNGFVIYDEQKFNSYSTANTDLVGISNDPNFLVITDVKADSKGNVWVANHWSAVNKQISVLTTNNTWNHYSMTNPTLSTQDRLDKMVIDQFDTKWFIIMQGTVGLYYFNEKGTFTNFTDDVHGNLTTNDGLITNIISSIAVDRRGYIWVGTSQGVNIIRNPANPKASNSITTVLALNNQTVNCIAVDPLDKKWIGTKQGLLVLSSDGFQVLNTYNSKNSPLPNDDIKSIAIDQKKGIVYVGTDNGLAAISTTSIQPVNTFDKINVYPQPFLLDGSGSVVSLDGLVRGSTLKIMSITGDLINNIKTPGGRVGFWDGRDLNGNYVSTGIYLAVAYDDEGNNVATVKIAVVKK